MAERADAAAHGVRGRIGDGQGRRLQARQVDVPSVRSVDRVVRAGLGDDLGDDVAGGRVDGVPVRSFKRRHVEQPAIGRQRQPVAPPGYCRFHTMRSVVRSNAATRRGVEMYNRPVPACAAMPLMFSGALPAGTVEGRNPPHERGSPRRCRRRGCRCRRARRSCGCRARRRRGTAVRSAARPGDDRARAASSRPAASLIGASRSTCPCGRR